MNRRSAFLPCSNNITGGHWKWQDLVIPYPRRRKIAAARGTSQEAPCRRHHCLANSRAGNADTLSPYLSSCLSRTIARRVKSDGRSNLEIVGVGTECQAATSTWRDHDTRSRSEPFPQKQPQSAHLNSWQTS